MSAVEIFATWVLESWAIFVSISYSRNFQSVYSSRMLRPLKEKWTMYHLIHMCTNVVLFKREIDARKFGAVDH